MEAQHKILTAIDVGTTKVCTIVARIQPSGQANIVGVGVVPSQGLKKGTVVDVEGTRKAVRASVELAEQEAGLRIDSAFVGVTGSHIESSNMWVPVKGIAGENVVITNKRLNQIRRVVQLQEPQSERQLLHTIPRSYALDGIKGIRNPVGMHARQFEMEAHMITGSGPVIRALVDAVEQAGIVVQGLVLEPLASGAAVLSDEERNLGVILVDIGGGTSDIAVFRDGAILYTAVIPVGGYQFTNDISMALDTPFEAAEAAKIKYGNTSPESVGLNEEIELSVFGQDKVVKVPRRQLCQLLHERSQELLQMVRLKLQQASLDKMPGPRLVLTGGSANLPGLDLMARHIVAPNVRIGVPMRPRGLPKLLVNPAYSTSVGILLWCMQEYPEVAKAVNGHHGLGALSRRLLSWFKAKVRKVPAAGTSLSSNPG